jgi:hypothetical protein
VTFFFSSFFEVLSAIVVTTLIMWYATNAKITRTIERIMSGRTFENADGGGGVGLALPQDMFANRDDLMRQGSNRLEVGFA